MEFQGKIWVSAYIAKKGCENWVSEYTAEKGLGFLGTWELAKKPVL